MSTDPDWEPLAHERQYYRSAETGDRGFLIRKGGKDHIQLDRGTRLDYETARVFREGDWVQESPDKPRFSEMQIAMVCFDADKALCKQMGDVKKATRQWLNLGDDQRIKWMRDGPLEPTRRAVYDAVKKAMLALGG